jgi:hypothetical protein
MAIVAPISRYKKTNLKIYICICVALAAWCIYDGYFNESFKTKYANEWQLTINVKSPPYLIGFGVLLGLYYAVIKNRKLVAGESELIFSNKKRIAYDSIEKIDKTYFDTKGHFTITYKKNDKEYNCKLSKWNYDSLKEVLDYLVEKISQAV